MPSGPRAKPDVEFQLVAINAMKWEAYAAAMGLATKLMRDEGLQHPSSVLDNLLLTCPGTVGKYQYWPTLIAVGVYKTRKIMINLRDARKLPHIIV